MSNLIPWVNNPQQLVTMRPGRIVSCVTDSIGVAQMGAWQQEVINHGALIYGDSAPTWITHGIAGVNIETATTNGQLAAAIADSPDVFLIELGVNDIFNTTHSLPPPTRSYIAGVAGTMLATIRASFPNTPIGWLTPLISGGEQWNPPASAVPPATVQDIVNGITDACATYGAQVIDTHSYWMAQEQILNPTQQPFGFISLEGTHPNWRGRPLLGRSVVDRLFWDNPLFSPNVDLTPSWTPDTDVTPTIWIEADQCTPGPVTSVGLGATFATYAGATSPTCVAAAWYNGGNVIRFNGVSDVMTSALTMAAGAKTLFAVYKVTVGPPTFGTWYSLLTVKGAGSFNSEFAPYANSSWGPVMAMFDQHANGSDGFQIINTNNIADSTNGNIGYPIRFAAQYIGSGPADVTKYQYLAGGFNMTPLVSSSGFTAQSSSCLTALGAKIDDGVHPSMYAALDLAALLVYPESLTTVQFSRVDQYLRRKWGP